MKNHKILSITTVIILTLSLIGISTSSAASSFSLGFGTDGIDYATSPYMVEAQLDVGEFGHANSLPVVSPFWADMVDKEHVANDGSGVYVAVLDTGLLPGWEGIFSEAHIRDDLGIGFSHDIYFDTGGNLVIDPVKVVDFETDLASGHGTHVTSTVVGFNLGGVWINGIAPNAQIIPVKVLDAWAVPTPGGGDDLLLSGGTDAMIASGIMYIADLASSLDGPVIINMSLGGPNPQAAIKAAIDYAISQGVIIVASAGNEGQSGMGYPGAFSEVISSAAAGWADMFNMGWTADVPENLKTSDSMGNTFQYYLEDFSSRPNKDLGQKHQDLDVAAPGAWVVGPYKSAFANNFGFYYLSGTSMASPHVAATAALVAQSYPDLTQSEMESILKLAARGMPLPASDAVVAFPFEAPFYYTASWDGGDYGAGFLTTLNAMNTAATHA